MKRIHEQIAYVEIPNGQIMNDPTNMFILGSDPVILIDTGSLAGLDVTLETLERLGNPKVEAILLTHVHNDHGENTDEVRKHVNAPVRFHELELPELAESKHDITLDEPIEEGEIIAFAGLELEAVLTPGHAAGHLAFIERNERFGLVGDLVTGWGSSAIFPPWGNLGDYIASMNKIADLGINPLYPSHGDAVTNGPEALRHFVKRRMQREEEIIQILDGTELPVEEIRDQLYPNIGQDLLSDINGNVILHLEKLEREGRVHRIQTEGQELFGRIPVSPRPR
jgi:glyoxylase-like metal-dependent hydrolase (beta-lactamase superfamily II)